jgi:hypothetical protein
MRPGSGAPGHGPSSSSSRFGCKSPWQVVATLTLLYLALSSPENDATKMLGATLNSGRSFVSGRRWMGSASSSSSSSGSSSSSSSSSSPKGGLWPWAKCLDTFPGLAGPRAYFPVDNPGSDYALPRQSDIPVYIIAYNNPTFVEQMAGQCDCYGSNVVVVDSASTYEPMKALLDRIEATTARNGVQHRVIRLERNAGPRGGAFAPSVFSEMPRYAAVTDADLAFNPNLPPNYLEVLANLTQVHRGHKVGFALDISQPSRLWPGIYGDGLTLVDFEGMWWKTKIGAGDSGLELYAASIDTTFAVYDLDYYRPQCRADSCHAFQGLRVAGTFTAQHVPWTINFTKGWDMSETMAAYGPPAKGSTISHKLREYGFLPPL